MQNRIKVVLWGFISTLDIVLYLKRFIHSSDALSIPLVFLH